MKTPHRTRRPAIHSIWSVLTVLTLSMAWGCLSIATIGDFKTTGTGGSASGGSSGSASGSSTGAATTTGTSGSTSGGSSSSSTGSSGGASSASSGGGSSTGGPLPPIIDGGYVFCAGSGASPGWTCRPGTYLCDLDGGPGNCFQCLSDADCADQSRPTYDPNRLHCDLSSGIEGYQNLCQQCVDDADCAGNSAGSYCELQVQYPGGTPTTFYGGILSEGYETCGMFELDCRADAGESCRQLNNFCDAANGACEVSSGSCTSDADCAGYIDIDSNNIDIGPILAPFCASDGRCTSCQSDGGQCPYDDDISCSSDAQCGGFWPVCLDAGLRGGLPAGGFCGCTENAQCGDAGLVCLPAQEANRLGSPYCGPPCTSPGFPACYSTSGGAVCDPSTGLCTYCTSDEQCQTSAGTQGPRCRAGVCGCNADSDCPAGESCTPGGTCVLPDLPCERDCFGQPGLCTTDYDCQDYAGPCCSGGACGACPGDSRVQCTGQSDCKTSLLGDQCEDWSESPLAGSCGCKSSADCNSPLATCAIASVDGFGTCEPICAPNVDCPAGLSCDPTFACRARCDDGGACPADAPLCDLGNREGQNGQSGQGVVPGAVWCYACLSASDCAASLGCGPDTGFKCSACGQDADCRTGEVCLDGGGCRSLCDTGACPPGEVCDSTDAVGLGADVCYQCTGPWDCAGNEGCNSQSRTCGSCWGPSELSDLYPGYHSFDCPPGDICSNFWTPFIAGACLQNCDLQPCPGGTTCAVFPELTPDHKYCFECVSDADCADAGPGAWCNLSPNPTFTCKTGPR